MHRAQRAGITDYPRKRRGGLSHLPIAALDFGDYPRTGGADRRENSNPDVILGLTPAWVGRLSDQPLYSVGVQPFVELA